MKDKPLLPVNPNGLIRAYLARQQTAQQPAITPIPTIAQPVTPLPAVLQSKTALLPTVAARSAQASSSRIPILIKPSGVVEPVVSLAQLPIRPASYAAHTASQAGSGPVRALMQSSGNWQAHGATQPVGTRTASASTRSAPLPGNAAYASQPTAVLPTVVQLPADQPVAEAVELPEPMVPDAARVRKRVVTRVLLVLVALGLVVALYIIWHGSAPSVTSPTVTQQQLTTPTSSASTTNAGGDTNATGMIEAYITGAVQHPGVYKLESGARVYELLRVAGGPLSNADLVTLNLAARLTDGEEVYVLTIGETPPVSVRSPPVSGTGATGTTGAGQLVDINTASVADMRQSLHVSASTAQKIVDYRQQHGSYTSVDQLLQVVSKSIYDKIKPLVTV